MQNKGKNKGRIILTILSGIAGIALFGYILIMSQSRMTLRSLQDEMKENSSYICDTFNFFKNRGKALQIWSDELYKDSFLVMKMALEDDPGLASSEDFLKEMTSLMGVQDIMFVDRNGKVTSSYASVIHDLKDDMYAPLFRTFESFEVEKLPVYSFSAENREARIKPIDAEEKNTGAESNRTEAGNTGEESTEAGNTGEENTEAGNTGEENTEGGKSGEENTEGGKTGEDNTEAGKSGEENTGAGRTESGKTEEDNADQKDSVWEESYYGVSNSFPVLYALAFDDQTMCVVNDYGVDQMRLEDLTNEWDYVLKNEVIGSGGYAFVWSDKTGELLYHPEADIRTRDVSSLGMDMDKIRDGQFVRQEVNGQDMYLYPVYFRDEDVWVVCAVPTAELSRGKDIIGFLIWLLFAVLAVDLVYYTVLLLKQKRTGSRTVVLPFIRQRTESGRRKKLLVFTFFCVLIIFLSSFYVQTLYLMSEWAKNSTAQVKKIENDLQGQEYLTESIQKLYKDESDKIIKMAGWYIENHPEKVTSQMLDMLAEMLHLKSISIIDENGKVLYADSSFSPGAVNTDKADDFGKVTGQESMEDSSVSDQGNRKVTVMLRGKDDSIGTYLITEYNPSVLEALKANIQLSNGLGGTMITVQPGEGGFVFAVNSKNGKFTWHPDVSLIGKNAKDYGLQDNDLQNNLCKYIQLNKNTYYAVTGQYKDDLIFLTIGNDKLLRQRLPMSVTATVAAFIILILTGIWLYTCPEAVNGTEDPEAQRVLENREKTAEHKVFRNLIFSAAGFAAILIVARYFRWNAAGGSILDYVLVGNWEHGVNVFALTASLLILFEGGLFLFLFHRIVGILSKMASVRMETVIRMLVNLVSYVVVFFILLRCLVYFGMDPAVLMTSAGIVSVVIGIGANSLVGDIIAGLFLLVEGNVQVGDMVKVGDFRGIVEDIGVRMTKIYDVDSENIKIIPNKEIQNVVHMSQHQANLFLEYPICYEEDLERVEKLLTEELRKPDGRIPEIIGELSYLGVKRLDDSGVILLVKAMCHEAYRPRVTRAVNRKVYMMFRRNGIEVPFPQLTIHDGDAADIEKPV